MKIGRKKGIVVIFIGSIDRKGLLISYLDVQLRSRKPRKCSILQQNAFENVDFLFAVSFRGKFGFFRKGIIYAWDVNLKFYFQPTKTMRIDRLEGKCVSMPNMTAYLSEYHMRVIKKLHVINTKLIVEESTSDALFLEFKVRRCKNKESSDTCEDMHPLHLSKLCELVHSKGQIWSPFVEKIEPKISCPVQKVALIFIHFPLEFFM